VSAFLNKVKVGDVARVFVKNSNFDLNAAVPMLMVGPGTGVVPFIAFQQEREVLKE
jgi:sulfite reductase alpha subunit-like flavoprotein